MCSDHEKGISYRNWFHFRPSSSLIKAKPQPATQREETLLERGGNTIGEGKKYCCVIWRGGGGGAGFNDSKTYGFPYISNIHDGDSNTLAEWHWLPKSLLYRAYMDTFAKLTNNRWATNMHTAQLPAKLVFSWLFSNIHLQLKVYRTELEYLPPQDGATNWRKPILPRTFIGHFLVFLNIRKNHPTSSTSNGKRGQSGLHNYCIIVLSYTTKLH